MRIAVVSMNSWAVAALYASDTAALVFIGWIWITLAGADLMATARMARAEDRSRAAAEALGRGAGAVSLVAVGFTLGEAGRAHAPTRDCSRPWPSGAWRWRGPPFTPYTSFA